MPELSFERHVPFTPAQMLALVADLDSYPDFVPNCTQMDVRDGASSDESMARMTIDFGPISQSYTSRVGVDAQDCVVRAEAIDGPFSHLVSQWRFTEEAAGTLVQFEVDFGFSSPLIAAAAGPVFSAKQGEIVDAFMDEAQKRYE